MEYLSLYFILGILLGIIVYISIINLSTFVSDKKQCKGNCNQGRNKCNCE